MADQSTNCSGCELICDHHYKFVLQNLQDGVSFRVIYVKFMYLFRTKPLPQNSFTPAALSELHMKFERFRFSSRLLSCFLVVFKSKNGSSDEKTDAWMTVKLKIFIVYVLQKPQEKNRQMPQMLHIVSLIILNNVNGGFVFTSFCSLLADYPTKSEKY